MEKRHRSNFSMGLIIGLLIVAAGVVLLLEKMKVIEEVSISEYWPVILILIGLKKLLQPGDWGYGRFFWGIIITAVGTLFLLNNLHYLHFGIEALWPVLIIIIGFEFIRGSLSMRRIENKWKTISDKDKEKFGPGCCSGFFGVESEDADFIYIKATLGGGKHKFTNQKLTGGKVSTVMGSCEIDLRNAEMEGDSMELEISSVMGGIVIWVPKHWQVVIHGAPLMGSIENKTTPPGNPVKRLFIKGSVIMGGVEIKN
ncbi:MAG TPA: DUF5668 domain-containing protein [Candidatus Kapabacteria bacterium]|nr:DUF5668 domain-containing protein [Candidatus Kapabacteria bacterium]